MGIAVLGPLQCDTAGSFGRRDRAVLTALAMCVGRAVSADQLADAVWGEAPPASSHKALQGCVVRLRKALGADVIETSAQGYRLVVPPDDVDFRRFERMVGRSRELLELGEPERASYVVMQALDLWRGRAFEDVESWSLAVIEGGRLEELRLEAEELHVDACLRTGRHLDVLANAESMVKAAPMRERRWTLLALAQYQAGRQTESLRTIHRVKSLLADKLGLDPGPELTSLEQSILRQDESLLTEGSVPASVTCPYQGLTPYDVDDSDAFFGRDDDVRACLDLLRSRDTLAVVGPSGSGKSSLVRAGVAAALRRDGLSVEVITPGAHPMQALSSVPDPSPRWVLLVDQCEEAFSLCDDESERRTFFAALVRWAETGPLVVAMRADRLSEVSAYPGFARLVERGLHLLGGMSQQGLRDAVEAPARQAGLLIEPGLVNLLVGEVEGTPGALPMLSHALLETWKRREGNTLTVAGYQATGGIRGAVAQSAEKVYTSIDPGRRQALRELVLRLVTAGAEGEPVRARVPRRLLSLDPEHEQLIDLLVASRLVTSDSGVVEIAHEALARAWPRLRAWLDDDMEGQRILHHLTGAADAWDSMGRPESELYRGIRLAQALQWRASRDAHLTDTEITFLAAAESKERSEQRAAAQRARAQGRLIRRLRGVVVGALVLLVAAIVAGGIAVQQKGNAEDNATAALTAQTSAEARRAGARALSTDDIDESMLLAAAGVQLDDSPETRSSLLAALGSHPELIASTQMAGSRVVYFDVSPDGRTVATYDTTNHVRLYEIASGDLAAEFQAGSDRLLAWESGKVRFSPDGRILAVTMAAPTRTPVMLLDARTLEPVERQLGGTEQWRWQGLGMTFSADGRHLATTMWRVEGSGDGTHATSTWAFEWDLVARSQPRRIALPDGGFGVALSGDGSVVYTSQPMTRHDTDGRSVPMKEPWGRPTAVEILEMSPNGQVLAASGPGGVALLNPSTGDLEQQMKGGRNDDGFYLNFSADGARLTTVVFTSREALVWEVASGDLMARLPLAEGGEVADLAADGSTLYTAGDAHALRQWDIAGDRQFIAQAAFAPDPVDLSFVRPSPGGEYIAYPFYDVITFFDVEANAAGEPVDRGRGYRRRIEDGSWHPDGVNFALATGGEIRIWDAGTGELVRSATPSGPRVTSVDFSTDGSRLATSELSGRVTMLDAGTLRPIGRSVQLDESVCCITAGPDNQSAFVLTGDGDASGFWQGSYTGWALLDLSSGTVTKSGELGFRAGALDFSPDGRHVAVGGADGELLVLDLESGTSVGPPVVIHDTVLALTYSADGRQLLTSGADASNGLWDGQTGRLSARVVTPHRFTEAGFGDEPDVVLIAPLWGGAVYEWNTDVEYAVDYACRVAGRDFTEAEWAEEFGDRPYQHVCRS